MNSLYGRGIHFNGIMNANWRTEFEDGLIKISGSGLLEDYELTVENLVCSILFHEWLSHGQHKVGWNFDHQYAYKTVMSAGLFWILSTETYKRFVHKMYVKFVINESLYRF